MKVLHDDGMTFVVECECHHKFRVNHYCYHNVFSYECPRCDHKFGINVGYCKLVLRGDYRFPIGCRVRINDTPAGLEFLEGGITYFEGSDKDLLGPTHFSKFVGAPIKVAAIEEALKRKGGNPPHKFKINEFTFVLM